MPFGGIGGGADSGGGVSEGPVIRPVYTAYILCWCRANSCQFVHATRAATIVVCVPLSADIWAGMHIEQALAGVSEDQRCVSWNKGGKGCGDAAVFLSTCTERVSIHSPDRAPHADLVSGLSQKAGT